MSNDNNKPITVSLAPDDIWAISNAAKQMKMNRSEFVRYLLKFWEINYGGKDE